MGPQGPMGTPGVGSQGEQVIRAFPLALWYNLCRPVLQTPVSVLDSQIVVEFTSKSECREEEYGVTRSVFQNF